MWNEKINSIDELRKKITANGNVFPCHQMSGYYEQHHNFLGNAKTESLQNLLSGGKYLDDVSLLCLLCVKKQKMRRLPVFLNIVTAVAVPLCWHRRTIRWALLRQSVSFFKSTIMKKLQIPCATLRI